MDDECCPMFDPTRYDDKVLTWKDKKFIKTSVRTFFYMPLNYGSVMKKLDIAVESGAMILSDHTSKWNMDIYAEVDKMAVGFKNVRLSGKYYSRVYEGKFSETGNWMKDFESYAKLKNLKIKKTYMWYTTCPKCAKKYGTNYVVVIGEVE